MKQSKQEKLEKALKNTKASFAVEGLDITDKEEKLIRAKANGEITREEFLREVKKLHGLQ
ncbi:antitoxin VbhA family protein [Priestia megaterium]|uniref:antitoxin VbhA family protein n=1 Tax=Priestia megaterium TaxID=1404 RepID=UPI0012B6BE7C|nr:antitoxin VbhA family protein [Priestia megaterium]